VEVAAGDGRLAAYLNAGDAPERGGALAVVATDDGSWGYSGAVEKLSVAQSLDRYCAEGAALVIVAWPPQGVDFTASFREKSSVRQYVRAKRVQKRACKKIICGRSVCGTSGGKRGLSRGAPPPVKPIARGSQSSLAHRPHMSALTQLIVLFHCDRFARRYFVIGDPTCTGTEATWAEHEGWRREEMGDLTDLQVARYDSETERCSRTVRYMRAI
jgi:hypothetical protein